MAWQKMVLVDLHRITQAKSRIYSVPSFFNTLLIKADSKVGSRQATTKAAVETDDVYGANSDKVVKIVVVVVVVVGERSDVKSERNRAGQSRSGGLVSRRREKKGASRIRRYPEKGLCQPLMKASRLLRGSSS